MEDHGNITIFIDDQTKPIASFKPPVKFELDTTKLVDGEHILKIIGQDTTGKEGIRKITFIVRNGPAIAIEGLQQNAIVDGVIPLMVNAYGKGNQKKFIIIGSETPRSVPAWLWILLISFVCWAAYYMVTNFSIGN